MSKPSRAVDVEPVRVIESIPIASGTPALSPRQVAAEKIPTPEHLLVGHELAQGGMGHVHPAVDKNLLRRVALKRLDKDYASDPLYRCGFIAEAQVNGQLEHPNIVPVYELAIDPRGIPYFTMKLVQGLAFDAWLEQHAPGTVERIEGGVEILLKVCDAVAYAHHRGVIHRDLKPANIMVGDFGQVYLMDWGLARLTRSSPASGADALMNAHGPVGTPDFMAPEQARGDPAEMDERCDIFGLGALLFELLSGMGPYGLDQDQMVLLRRAQAGEVMSIDQACGRFGVSKRIRAIAQRATDPDPSKRYQSVADFQSDLRAFLSGGLHLPRKSFRPGEIIFREGDRGDAAYMIVAGRCRAFRTVQGQEETLAVMEPGEAFGEMALLLFEPRAASVAALDEVTVLVLDQATMNEGLGLSGWTGALVRALAQRFADLEQLVRSSGLRRK
ncbi:MAG: protein kinase [Deltaproteobacteria bacterium]|nr:protein kinase [Deltaproteobacteria bacterium]